MLTSILCYNHPHFKAETMAQVEGSASDPGCGQAPPTIKIHVQNPSRFFNLRQTMHRRQCERWLSHNKSDQLQVIFSSCLVPVASCRSHSFTKLGTAVPQFPFLLLTLTAGTLLWPTHLGLVEMTHIWAAEASLVID